MAAITIQSTSVSGGLNPTWSAASPTGDTFGPNTGAQTVMARNQGQTPLVVNIAAQHVCNQGSLHPKSFTIPAGAVPFILGTFLAQFYNDASGNVGLTYSATVLAPPGAVTAAAQAGVALGIGTYRYAVTLANASGETTAGTEVSVVTTSGNQAIQLSGIPLGPAGTTARKIYRTSIGGAAGSEKLVGTLSDNTTTTFTDTIPDGLLGAALPGTNTAAVAPPGAASLAAGAAGLPNGTYRAQVTFTNAAGETTGGVEFTITVTSTHIAWSNIPIGPTGTTGRKLYRTAAGGAAGTEKLVTTIGDNTTTTFDDNVADASLGAAIPAANAANVLQVAVTQA